jgi:hypothetical protein
MSAIALTPQARAVRACGCRHPLVWDDLSGAWRHLNDRTFCEFLPVPYRPRNRAQ